MPSLLLVVFVLQVALYLINTVGAAAINDFLWLLYNRLPTSTSHDVRKQIELRRDVVRLKREMNATSSQDEFAKWAKIRRAHDKRLAEYDEISNNLKGFQQKFTSAATTLRYISTTGLRFLLQFWYAKAAMFWIPQGWVPWYVEWMLSFPRAPMGSVSIQVWGISCASVVGVVGSAVVAGLVLVQERRVGRVKEKVGMKGGKKEL
ncbi:MAG: GET complex subunit get1 [Ramalina farinacea]|uniref:GET complex subunit get1 n=1 Tax=Ramalina farinacea TaxID=258253 RepID=A0AA43QK35_9LECA|nr:GET complex subunit get1 [Ramalina farinacea]